MDVNLFKYIAMASLFAMGMCGGLAPIKLGRVKSAAKWLSLGNMFSGGVFLGGGLIHLLPESSEDLTAVASKLNSPILANFPYAFLLCGLGFFAILLVEEIVLAASHTNSPTKTEVKELIAGRPTLTAPR